MLCVKTNFEYFDHNTAQVFISYATTTTIIKTAHVVVVVVVVVVE